MKRSGVGVILGTVFATCVCFQDICASQTVLSYHGHPDRNGNFIVPSLTWDKARRLHLDEGFRARMPGHLYAQPLYWRAPGSASGILLLATEDNVSAIDASAVMKFGAKHSASPYPAARFRAETSTPWESLALRSSMNHRRQFTLTPRFKKRPGRTILCSRCLSRTAQL